MLWFHQSARQIVFLTARKCKRSEPERLQTSTTLQTLFSAADSQKLQLWWLFATFSVFREWILSSQFKVPQDHHPFVHKQTNVQDCWCMLDSGATWGTLFSSRRWSHVSEKHKSAPSALVLHLSCSEHTLTSDRNSLDFFGSSRRIIPFFQFYIISKEMMCLQVFFKFRQNMWGEK